MRGYKHYPLVLLICVYIFHQCLGLYSKSSPVQVLEATDFHNKVKNGDDIWLVEFFAPWCGHCKTFAPEYDQAAKALKGIIKVAAIEDQTVMSSEGIKGFPTVKLYLGKTNGVVDFNLGRTSEGVIDFVFNVLRSVAKKRLNQNTSSTGNKKSKKPISSLSSDVLEINDDNFDETVMKDNKSVWLLELYAPWCGHCKALTPIWEDVATKLKNKVKVAKIDATVSVSLAAKFSVKGYPTLILLPSGEKSISAGIPYNGPRKSESIVSFAMGFASDAVKASQLLSDKQFHDECDKGVCIISFLPHLIDSGAEGRKNYLKQLNGAFKASSAMPVKFFWVQAGDNLELEESLRLQFGWPAVIATRLDKSKYSIHKGDFSDESIRSFLTGLMAGRNTLSPIPETLPKFSSTIEWDGKDFSAEENLSKSKDEL